MLDSVGAAGLAKARRKQKLHWDGPARVSTNWQHSRSVQMAKDQPGEELQNKELGISKRMGGKSATGRDNASEFGSFGGRKPHGEDMGDGLELSPGSHKVTSPTAKLFTTGENLKRRDLGAYDITPGEKGRRADREADSAHVMATQAQRKSYQAGDEYQTHERLWKELGGIDPAGREFGRHALDTPDHATGARDLSLDDEREDLVKGSVARRGPPRMDQLKGMGAGRAPGGRESVPYASRKMANPGQIKGGKI